MKGRDMVRMLRSRIEDSGFESAELYHQERTALEINCFEGEISGYTRSRREGVAARVERGRRIGSAFSESVRKGDIDKTLKQADGQIDFLPADRGNALYPGNKTFFDSSRVQQEVRQLPDEYKTALVLKLERAARSLDKRIATVPRAVYSETSQQITVVNSYGLGKSETVTSCGVVLQVAAKRGKQTHVHTAVSAGDSFFILSALSIAQEAVMGALEKFNPRGIASGAYPAVLSADAASSIFGACLLSHSSHLYGENVLKGRSRYAGRLGQPIASPLVTLWDNPEGSAVYKRKFDDEGFPTKRFVLIRRGVLKDFARSIYAAALGRSSPTGHSLRGGYCFRVATGLHSPCLANGEADLEELFDQCTKGVYITEVDGLHAGVNSVSGDFSLSARGYFIEGGKKGKPIGQCTIAGNVYECLGNISGIADDRRLDTFRRFSSPSVLLPFLDVSG